MHVKRKFHSDGDVQRAFADCGGATNDDYDDDVLHVEYISPITPHTMLAGSLLLDEDCAPLHSPLRVSTVALTKSLALQAARDVRAASLQHLARENGRREICCISMPPDGNEPHSSVKITVYEYSVPVAYRVLGQLDNVPGEPQFAVRVVRETHCYAAVTGSIVAVDGGMVRPRDTLLITAIQEYGGKVAETPGDPLPIAEALARIYMSTQSGGGGLSDDVKALLRADEVETNVDVIEAVPTTVGQQLTQVLEHTLKQMGIVARNNNDEAGDLPPLI